MSSIRPPIPVPIGIDLAIDLRVLEFTVTVAALAGLTAGLAPAFSATRPGLAGSLKGDTVVSRAGGHRASLSDVLVAAQIAFALVLLVVGGLLARSAMAASRVALAERTPFAIGFNPNTVFLPDRPW